MRERVHWVSTATTSRWAGRWLRERGARQRAYQVRVGLQPGGVQTWDAGKVVSDRQVDVRLPDTLRLQPATRYHWQVRVLNLRVGSGHYKFHVPSKAPAPQPSR